MGQISTQCEKGIFPIIKAVDIKDTQGKPQRTDNLFLQTSINTLVSVGTEVFLYGGEKAYDSRGSFHF